MPYIARKQYKPKPKYPRRCSVPRNLQFKQEERKYLDNQINNVDPTSSGTVLDLAVIAEGTDFNQRVGRKIKAMYIQYDMLALMGGTSYQATTPVAWTFHIVLDRSPNTTLPGYSTVFDTSSSVATFAMKNISAFAERFKILKTESGLVYTGNSQACKFKGYVKLNQNIMDSIVQYASSGGTVPSANNFMLCYSQSGASNNVLFSGTIRFCYCDL